MTQLNDAPALRGELRRSEPVDAEVGCRSDVEVELTVPPNLATSFADIVSDFMAWVPVPMRRCHDGSFIATMRLPRNRTFAYRFLLDGERLVNDLHAHDYAELEDGSWCSLLHT